MDTTFTKTKSRPDDTAKSSLPSSFAQKATLPSVASATSAKATKVSKPGKPGNPPLGKPLSGKPKKLAKAASSASATIIKPAVIGGAASSASPLAVAKTEGPKPALLTVGGMEVPITVIRTDLGTKVALPSDENQPDSSEKQSIQRPETQFRRKLTGTERKWIKYWRSSGKSEAEVTNLLEARRLINDAERLAKAQGTPGGVGEKIPPEESKKLPPKVASSPYPKGKPVPNIRKPNRPGTATAGTKQAANLVLQMAGAPSCAKVKELGKIPKVSAPTASASGVEPNSKKRTRSDDSTPKGATVKRARDSLFSEIAKGCLNLCVIDTNHPLGKINSSENQKALEKFITDSQWKAILEKEPFLPDFVRSGFRAGVFHFTAADERTVNWLKKKLNDCKLGDSVSLSICTRDEIPTLRRVRVFIPAELRKPEEVLLAIDALNEEFNGRASSWNVFAHKKCETGLLLILGVDLFSYSILEKNRGIVKFINRRIQFKLNPPIMTPPQPSKPVDTTITGEKTVETFSSTLVNPIEINSISEELLDLEIRSSAPSEGLSEEGHEDGHGTDYGSVLSFSMEEDMPDAPEIEFGAIEHGAASELPDD
jgi:Domain of unknown function (DUF4780)